MDELTEFKRDVLEFLRQPLEDGFVSISRTRQSVTFPAQFTLVNYNTTTEYLEQCLTI